jgi:hypothetical protein
MKKKQKPMREAVMEHLLNMGFDQDRWLNDVVEWLCKNKPDISSQVEDVRDAIAAIKQRRSQKPPFMENVVEYFSQKKDQKTE